MTIVDKFYMLCYHVVMIKDFYSIKEFAKLLSISERTVRRAIKNKRISALRVGSTKKSTYRIPHSEITRMSLFDIDDFVKQKE